MPFVSVFTSLPVLKVPFVSVVWVFRDCVGRAGGGFPEIVKTDEGRGDGGARGGT